MAATAFPARSYPTALDRTNAATNRAPFGGAQPSFNPSGAFGAVGQQQQSQMQQREAARLDRERQERDNADRGPIDALQEEQREEVNEAFALFDLNKDGYIDYHELRVALKALGFELPKTEVLALLQSHGVQASSISTSQPNKFQPQSQNSKPAFSGPSKLVLSHPSFLSIASQLIVQRDPRDEILRAFDLFDTDGKGALSLDDLRRVAKELGEGIQEEELADMIHEFDTDDDGLITREDFLSICMD